MWVKRWRVQNARWVVECQKSFGIESSHWNCCGDYWATDEVLGRTRDFRVNVALNASQPAFKTFVRCLRNINATSLSIYNRCKTDANWSTLKITTSSLYQDLILHIIFIQFYDNKSITASLQRFIDSSFPSPWAFRWPRPRCRRCSDRTRSLRRRYWQLNGFI